MNYMSENNVNGKYVGLGRMKKVNILGYYKTKIFVT
jgi:hypothetical protein